MDYDKETLMEMLKESLRQNRAEMALVRLSVNEALKVIEASIQEARQALGYNKYNES